MKVRLITKRTLNMYALQNSGARLHLKYWMIELRRADWSTPNDILNSNGSVDLLGNGSARVVFDLGGNKYRLICKYVFGDKFVRLYVKWISTHSEYDKLCRLGNQYSCSDY